MWATLQDLRATASHALADPAQDDTDREAFLEYARDRTCAYFPLLGYGIALAAAVWWPVDWLVYSDPHVIEGLARLRVVLVVMNVGFAAILPRLDVAVAHAQSSASATMLFNVLVAAWSMAEIGRGDPLFLSLSYLLPLFGMVLLQSLPVRCFVMGLVALATLVGWGVHPDASYATPGAAACGSFLVFCCLVSIGVGHGMFLLIRRSFHLHLQVDRQRDALAYLTAHLEQRVADQTRAIKTMHQRAQNVRAEQRGELARDLHDSLGQELTSLRLLVAFGRHGGDLDEVLHDLDTQVDRLQGSLRRVLVALRPEGLDELGLVEALRVLALELQRRSGLDIRVDVSPDFPAPLPTAISLALYRVSQEALNNALRHARARRIELVLSSRDGRVNLRIADDGVGLDPEALGSGLGTRSIRDRVTALAGDVRWDGEAGTTVSVSIPLEEAA